MIFYVFYYFIFNKIARYANKCAKNYHDKVILKQIINTWKKWVLSHSLNLISRSLDIRNPSMERLIESRKRHNILSERLIKLRERVIILRERHNYLEGTTYFLEVTTYWCKPIGWTTELEIVGENGGYKEKHIDWSLLCRSLNLISRSLKI